MITVDTWTYEVLSILYSSSCLLNCDLVDSSPSSRLSDAHDTAFIGGCGFGGVSGRRSADLLGEVFVWSVFDFPERV